MRLFQAAFRDARRRNSLGLASPRLVPGIADIFRPEKCRPASKANHPDRSWTAMRALFLVWSRNGRTSAWQRLSRRLDRNAPYRFVNRRSGIFSTSVASASKKTAHATEQERPDVATRRHDWFNGQPELDPNKLIFIDETGASTKMARLRGRAKKGERCRAAVPHAA